MDKINIGYSPRTVKIADNDYLHFWYANNKGRGTNNCTIVRTMLSRRAAKSSDQPFRYRTTTSSWNGHVNFSKRVQAELGIF